MSFWCNWCRINVGWKETNLNQNPFFRRFISTKHISSFANKKRVKIEVDKCTLALFVSIGDIFKHLIANYVRGLQTEIVNVWERATVQGWVNFSYQLCFHFNRTLTNAKTPYFCQKGEMCSFKNKQWLLFCFEKKKFFWSNHQICLPFVT